MSLAFVALLLFGGVSTALANYDIVLGWDPNYDPDLAGYILYVDDGTTPMPYGYVDTYELDDLDPVNPMIKIDDLKNGTVYYFVLTAYDIDGNESDYSDEICVMDGKECPASFLSPSVSSSGSEGGGGGGGGGVTCFIGTALNNLKPTFASPLLLFAIGFLSSLPLMVVYLRYKGNGF